MSLMARLSALTRFSMERPSERESVLEHTGFVALFVLVLVSEINLLSDSEDEPVDVGQALTYALVHDLEEVITGDVARPTKYFCREAVEMFDRLSEIAADKVAYKMRSFPEFSERLRSDIPTAKTDREGCLVAIADCLAVVYMVWREVLVRGNVSMIRQAFSVVDQIDALTARVAVSDFSEGQHGFLCRMLSEGRGIMLVAQKLDNPIYGTMREDC